MKDLFFDYTKITVADLIRKAKENKKIQDFFEAIKFDKVQNDHAFNSQGIGESSSKNIADPV